MPVTTHKYTNGEITILWQPKRCIHSNICVKGLGAVFNPSKTPWIDITRADSNALIEQVKNARVGH